MASTVSVTGFSVAQTGKSVALTVGTVSVFRPAQSLFASVCAAEFVNIYDHEIHVFRQVCNNFCATQLVRPRKLSSLFELSSPKINTTTKTTRTTFFVVQVVPVVV